jgi:multidrug transporter EmrE-like cation transporter
VSKKLAAILLLCFVGMSAQILMKKGLTRAGGFNVRSIFPSLGRMIMEPLILMAGACVVVAFLLYLAILSKTQLSAFYPILVGLNFILLGVSSSLFLNEPLNLAKILGLALILGGISCFALSKSGI